MRHPSPITRPSACRSKSDSISALCPTVNVSTITTPFQILLGLIQLSRRCRPRQAPPVPTWATTSPVHDVQISSRAATQRRCSTQVAALTVFGSTNERLRLSLSSIAELIAVRAAFSAQRPDRWSPGQAPIGLRTAPSGLRSSPQPVSCPSLTAAIRSHLTQSGYVGTVPLMPSYDAIVIGARHNGLTAAAVMARGGMRVLCLEKNVFIGGMSSTTEFTAATASNWPGSSSSRSRTKYSMTWVSPRAPSTNQKCNRRASVHRDSHRSCCTPTPTDSLSASRHDRSRRRDGYGGSRSLGRGPRTAIGNSMYASRRFDEMWACASNEEHDANPCRHVRQRDGRHRSVPPRPQQTRPCAQHVELPSGQLHLSRPVFARAGALPSPCLASPGDATMSKVRGGAMSDHLLGLFERTTVSFAVACSKFPRFSYPEDHGGESDGVHSPTAMWVTAPVVVSNLEPQRQPWSVA